MSTPIRLKLAFAQRCADTLSLALAPFVDRLEVAGSIRRQRPLVGDIDLVVIPKVAEERDLLGNLVRSENLCAAEIRRLCAKKGWEIKQDGEHCLIFNAVTQVSAQIVQVDLWFATPETFGSVLLCRTGSKEHNVKLCQRAQALGGHWNTTKGVQIGTEWFPATTEQEIFAALGLPFVEPQNRH